jgi:valyl-tRNA synthetase
MDTWMTSSITPLINCHWQEEGSTELMEKIYPMTLRVQAFEIIRTWLFYTIVKSHFHTNSLPWQKAMISGWGLDSKGKKISKSSGNSADAEVLIDRYSADALRFWASDSDLGHDHRFREEELQAGRRLVIKLTNAARFASRYLSDYAPEDPMDTHLEDSDRWILMKLNSALKEYHASFQGFEYSKARRVTDKLFWSVFCDNYLEFIKHRLNRAEPDESSRAAQATLYKVLLALTQMYAPFVPFVAEEAYQSLFASKEGCLSVHISRLPAYQEELSLEISDSFETSLDAVVLIRKYRSQTGLSFKTQIATVWFEAENGAAIDTEFVATIMNVGEILPKSVEDPTVSSNKLKLHIAG